MSMEVLKGTKDSEPSEQKLINSVTDKIRGVFESFGFRPFDTPIIEYWDTLTKKYDEDDEIVHEIFKVEDRGNRKLGMRYDLTVPLCRYVSSRRDLKTPFRRYHIAKVFRNGPLKKGRLREFFQCDADVVGIEGREVEAEMLEMFYSTYKSLELNVVIEINNNKILRGAFLQQGFVEEDLSTLILSVDKLKKIGKEGVLDEIEEKGYNRNSASKGISILETNDFDEIESLSENTLLKEGIEELKELNQLVEGVVETRINFSMARGLNIYTGNIWEVFDKQEKVTSSLGAGGRFDSVIKEYSEGEIDLPAVGVSFGLVPIMELLKENQGESSEGVTDVLVVPLKKDVASQALNIASKLREENNTEVYYGYNLKKAFDYADFLGAEKVAIIGEKDIEEGVYTLKNLSTKEEEKIPIKN